MIILQPTWKFIVWLGVVTVWKMSTGLIKPLMSTGNSYDTIPVQRMTTLKHTAFITYGIFIVTLVGA